MSALVGLLLAAGRGHRFGSDKLMHCLPDGDPLVVASARRLAAVTDRTVALVRPQHAALHDALTKLGIECVEVAEADAGIGNTLAAGVRATSLAAGWMVALGDMPCVHHDTMREVALALRAGASIVAPFHDGQRGHPVGFSQQWYEVLQGLQGDEGARHILRAQTATITRIDVDDSACLFDVDVPCDIERMLGSLRPLVKDVAAHETTNMPVRPSVLKLR